MDRKEVEEVKSWIAHGPGGRSYRLHHLQHYIVGRSSDGPYKIPGMKELRTSDGGHVNWLSKGNYLLVATGETLTSNDPLAE